MGEAEAAMMVVDDESPVGVAVGVAEAVAAVGALLVAVTVKVSAVAQRVHELEALGMPLVRLSPNLGGSKPLRGGLAG